MSRRTALVVILVAGIAALSAGIYVGRSDREPSDGTQPGQAAATLLGLTLPDVAGKETSLAQWRGKLLVVNFWATWCAPCREEMPEFVRLQAEFGGKGLQFVGIALDDADKVGQFAAEIGLNYPALIGGYGAMELSKTLGNRLMALPFTVIVSRDGTIAHTQLGPLKGSQLRAMVGKLI
jgi:thiol-disulfide isomerase/thioredoxin